METISEQTETPAVAVIEEDQTWILGLLAVITAAILAYFLKPDIDEPEIERENRPLTKKEDLTLSQLRKYDGTNGRPTYIAVKGTIFNVSSHPSGIELYGRYINSLPDFELIPLAFLVISAIVVKYIYSFHFFACFLKMCHDSDSPYNVFAGRDATVGLARGNYDVEEEYDLDEMDMFEYDNLEQWYHWTFMAKYDIVGKLIPESSSKASNTNDGESVGNCETIPEDGQDNSHHDEQNTKAKMEILVANESQDRGLSGLKKKLTKQPQEQGVTQSRSIRSSMSEDNNPNRGKIEFSDQQKAEELDLLQKFGARLRT